MTVVTVRANAKLNLTLDILSRRADGYHELSTVMQSVSLYDRVTVKKAADIAVTSNTVFVPTDARNLAFRAASLFFERTGVEVGAHIDIRKRIPVSAGLAGGSADAAAVLAALNRLYGTGLSLEQLMEFGASLGADVPFCVHGGTALCEGVGERVSDLPPLPPCLIVVARAGRKPSTAQIYAEFDRRGTQTPPATPRMVQALSQRSLPLIAARLSNSFEQVALTSRAASLKEALKKSGAFGVVMSGSGPAVFGLFDGPVQARQACEGLRELGADAFLCRSVRCGCYFEKTGRTFRQA